MRIVKHSFTTNGDLLQVLLSAIINSGPDSTWIGRVRNVCGQAVDDSLLRSANQGIWLLCTGAQENELGPEGHVQ